VRRSLIVYTVLLQGFTCFNKL